MASEALRAATEAALEDWVMRRCGLELSPLSIREGAEQILTAHYEALLGDIPEDVSVDAALEILKQSQVTDAEASRRGQSVTAVVLRSLRSSLGDTDGS